MPVITCNDLSVGYAGHAVASHIQLTVQHGDYLCVIGENGSGNSTLLATMLGLLHPVAGTVVLDPSLRGAVGYLPQRTEAQKDFPASVREVVMTGFVGAMGSRPFYVSRERSSAAEAMERVGVADLAHRSFAELSGGPQPRVQLARALVAARGLLVLAEPVTGLDPDAAADMYALVDSLVQDDHMTVVMVSHDVEEALERASRVLAMGKPPFTGTPDEYRAARQAVEAVVS